MRKIHLPDLVSIKIQNFTLYPNGLDFEYSFVKGVNLILGGNGMGKTTFVNIIRYAIIGHYKKQFDYTRTYRDQKIERRKLYPIDYFKNRMDPQIVTKGKAKVIIEFVLDQTRFVVVRDLEEIMLNYFSVNDEVIEGKLISQIKYEALNDVVKPEYLQYRYEKLVEKYSGLPFDDVIFFINEILYFGENHKTILWDEEQGEDVQMELFNKFFNSPELEVKRQEALRQAKYFDSLSRHRSEDIRAIKKVLDKINETVTEKSDPIIEILSIKSEIEEIENRIEKNQSLRVENNIKSSLIQGRINVLVNESNDLEIRKNKAERDLVSNVWETLHPQYELFTKNIKVNHICPICNRPSDNLSNRLLENPNSCFTCGTELKEINSSDLKDLFAEISKEYNALSQEIQNNQREIRVLDDQNTNLDAEFNRLEMKNRELKAELRTREFSKSKKNETSDLQPFIDEIERLEMEKIENQLRSKQEVDKAESFYQEIKERIIESASQLSSLFSSFAGSFLGVQCSLTFDALNGQDRRFYPVIDGRIRRNEEELSESQRFFVDHSFRMSILSFFYITPMFYIVETPDSSLDISYERNAADVFLKFLRKPNSLIITSNLNNSSFVNYIIDNNEDIDVSIVGLPDIAKQSVIQNTSETLLKIYNDIKSQLNQKNNG